MVNKFDVIKKLTEELNQGVDVKSEIQLILSETLETEKYWVFFYNTKKFLETQNFSFSLVGNAPIIVDKKTGKFFYTGTAHPLEHYLSEYEKNRK